MFDSSRRPVFLFFIFSIKRTVKNGYKITQLQIEKGFQNAKCASDCYLKAVVSPRAEFHDASLIIEREVSHVDGAGAAKFSGWWPKDVAVVAHHRFAVHVASSVIVGTAFNQNFQFYG